MNHCPIDYGLSSPAPYFTVTVTWVLVRSAPSLAVAVSTYVPGWVKCAAVTAWPLLTGIGPVESKVTFAGPPYCIQVTDSPALGRSVALFV